jgi:hypothetical protein
MAIGMSSKEYRAMFLACALKKKAAAEEHLLEIQDIFRQAVESGQFSADQLSLLLSALLAGGGREKFARSVIVGAKGCSPKQEATLEKFDKWRRQMEDARYSGRYNSGVSKGDAVGYADCPSAEGHYISGQEYGMP